MSLLLLLRRRRAVASSLLTGLAAYWTLDEASGPRADSLGVSTLTDNNTVTQNPGKVGTAAQFTSANSEYLSRADSPALSMGDIDFTIALWIYFDGTGRALFLGKGNATGTGDEYYFDVFNGGGFAFSVGNGTTSGALTATTFGTPTTATWYFVIGWHDSVANTVNIQINDTAAQSTAYSGGSYDSGFPFGLGRDGSLAALYLNGRLDEVGIWKRVLTAGERTALYNGGAGRSWPFTGA